MAVDLGIKIISTELTNMVVDWLRRKLDNAFYKRSYIKQKTGKTNTESQIPSVFIHIHVLDFHLIIRFDFERRFI